MSTTSTYSDEHYKRARQLADSGKYCEAIDAYSSALQMAPCFLEAQVGRALALQRIGKDARAIADLDSVVSINSSWPGAFIVYYSRAISRYNLGDFWGAIVDCNEAISRNQECVDAVYLRGAARSALGHSEEAKSDMDGVLTLDPSYREAHVTRGLLNCSLGCWDEAMADFTAATALTDREDSYALFMYRGIAAQEVGDHHRAIADLTQALERIPHDSAAYLRRSRSFRALGQDGAADSDIQIGMMLTRTQL